MSQVEVLCPNGHRVTISVSNTTKIIKVLEEACLRKGFLPTYDYEIRHGKKSLELSLSIKEAGLINHAKLELVKRTKPWVESKVVVQIQMSDGGKVQREFMPNTTLFEILERFEEDDGRGGHPKLLYHTDKTFHPVLLFIKEEIVGEYALQETTLKCLGALSGRVMFRHMYRQISNDTLKQIEDDIKQEKVRILKLLEKATALVDLEKSHMTQTPGSSAEPPVVSPNPPSVTEDATAKIPAISNNTQEMTLRSNDTFFPQQMVTFDQMDDDSHDNQLSNVPLNPFANFKFPEETRGKNLYRNELNEVNRGEFQSCDRELVVYRLDESMEVDDNAREEIPDVFFEVTEMDLAILQKDLERNVKRMSGQPLLTQAMRQQELEARLSKYKRVVIRVQFPDRLVVQGVFQPKETVYAVYKFVKELLDNESFSFELYTTPPKHVLQDKTQTLIEANLVPLSLLYFGSVSKVSDALVKNVILSQLANQYNADEVVSKFFSENADQKQSETKKTTKPATNPPQNTKATVPKWMKLAKK